MGTHCALMRALEAMWSTEHCLVCDQNHQYTIYARQSPERDPTPWHSDFLESELCACRLPNTIYA